LSLKAKRIYLELATHSINFSGITLEDFLWYEAAFLVHQEIESKKYKMNVEMNADMRALLKDLSDIQRLKASGGKTNSIIKWEDLPSQANNKKEKIEDDPNIRKEFLRAVSKKYKNK
jgi:hypothetical protein